MEKKINIKFKRKAKEPVEPISIEEARERLEKAREEVEAKVAEKEAKKKEKADRKLEAKLNLGTPMTNKVAELVAEGVVTKADLVDEFGKVKNFLDIIEEYQDHPQDDEPEDFREVTEEPEQSPEEKIVTPFGGSIVVSEEKKEDEEKTESTESSPAFNMSSYTIDENGEVHQTTSSVADANGTVVPNDQIQDMIVNDSDLKEVYPSINRNDISINNGIILIKIPKDAEVEELYRLDLIGNQIYVQAPLDAPIENFYYVSVPICTEIGKEILKNSNYVVNAVDVDINHSVFREKQDDIA